MDPPKDAHASSILGCDRCPRFGTPEYFAMRDITLDASGATAAMENNYFMPEPEIITIRKYGDKK